MTEEERDHLKWFGEGFDGFPKRLPDDCVEYCIYIVNEKLNDFEIREKLRYVQHASTALARKLLKNYIWQRDGFDLELVKEAGKVLCSISTCRRDL